jgi:hypothetical protein
MADPIDYITFDNIQAALNISITAVLVAILILQLLVRRGSVKLHYYFLLAANIFALVTAAIIEGNANDVVSKGSIIAIIVLGYVSDACLSLTAVFALRQFTISHLGGPTFAVTAMCSLAVVVCLAVIIVSGFYAHALVSLTISNILIILWTVDLWTFFALWVWLLLILLVIRITYSNKVPRNENRSIIIKTFALIALYIFIIFVFYLYTVIEAYVPMTSDTQSFGILIGNEIFDILFYRLSALFFVFFYNKLSVMAPIPVEKNIYEDHEV